MMSSRLDHACLIYTLLLALKLLGTWMMLEGRSSRSYQGEKNVASLSDVLHKDASTLGVLPFYGRKVEEAQRYGPEHTLHYILCIQLGHQTKEVIQRMVQNYAN